MTGPVLSVLRALGIPLVAIVLLGGAVNGGLLYWGPTPNGEYRSLVVDGVERTYLLHVPPDLPDGPVPLVVVLHAAYSWSDHAARQTGFSEKADEEGFIVAYPDGVGRLPHFFQFWNAGHCCYRALEDGVDDMGFLSALLDELLATLPVDSGRVYLVGMSNGGMLASWFAAEHTDRIAGLAAVASTIGRRDEVGEVAWRVPDPKVPLSVIEIHGLQDHAVPFDGTASLREPAYVPISAEETARFWAENAGLTDPPRVEESADGKARMESWGEAGGVGVALVTVRDGGHSWPGSEPIPFFSKPSQAVEATDLIWDFFQTHPSPPAPAH